MSYLPWHDVYSTPRRNAIRSAYLRARMGWRDGKEMYFIEAEGQNRIKIGVARDPEERMSTLQAGSPVKLKLLGTVAGGQAREIKTHKKLAKWHVRGEWFEGSKEVRSYIEEALREAADNA